MPETVIVRLPNWLGDTVMAVPAIRALRAGLPDARIALAGPWVSLLRGQTLADVLVDYPRAWSRRLRAADEVRALRPDVAVLLPNSLESALAAWYWGAGRRVGFAADGRGGLLTDRVPLPDPRRHQADEYRVLAGPVVGADGDDGVPRLRPPATDGPEARAARTLLDGERSGARAPVVGVHLGAAFGPSKLWPVDRVAELCRRLIRRGLDPVLLGAPGDRASEAQVRAQVRVRSLVGRDSPDTLPALLAALDLLVCGDTGVGHLAAALGTPVVALFGPTDPALSSPRGPVIVIRRPAPCTPCPYRRCPIDHPCMRALTADEVAAAAEARLRR
jgi:heptosyltransferase-2